MKRVFIYLFLISNIFLQAQTWSQDTLKQLLGVDYQNPTLRLQKAIAICNQLYYSQPLKAKAMAFESLRYSQSIDSCLAIAASYNLLGVAYDVTSAYDSAIYMYEQAIESSYPCKGIGTRAEAFNNMGLVYWNKGDYDKAIDYYFKALPIFEEYEIEHGVAHIYNNLGLIYTDKDEIDKAIDFHKKALQLRLKLEDDYGVSASYSNLGRIYSGNGLRDSAIVLLKKSIKIKEEINDKRGLAINYNVLGGTLIEQGIIDVGAEYVKKSIDVYKTLGDSSYMSLNYNILAKLYIDEKDFSQAQLMIDSAYSVIKGIGVKKTEAQICERQIDLYLAMGDYKAAALLYPQCIALNDAVFDIEKEGLILEVEEKYESAARELELAKSKAELSKSQLEVRRRTLVVVLLSFLTLLVIIISVFSYKQIKFKQEKLEREAQLKEALSKAELYNKIQAERTRISRDLHDQIGSQLTIISSALDGLAHKEKNIEKKDQIEEIGDNTRLTMTQLRETIWVMNNEEVDLEMFSSKIREFTNKVDRFSKDGQSIVITNDVKGNVKLTPAQTINLFRVCQEAVNNALKHADFTEMKIKIEEHKTCFNVCVIDDGKGFDVAEAKRKGYGLINMYERIKDIGGKLEIVSQKNKGTTLSIDIQKNASFSV